MISYHQNILTIKVNPQVLRLSSATAVRSCPTYKPSYATLLIGIWYGVLIKKLLMTVLHKAQIIKKHDELSQRATILTTI